MSDLAEYRRFFAEEIEAVAKLRTPALVEALANVPRERFLRPGPWTIVAESEAAAIMTGSLRTGTTRDADPRRVYHNVVIGIDPSRQLFNGQPGTLAAWIDALGLRTGERVLHIGCGLGYYTAVMAHVVGPAGRVVAYEVDPALAAEAGANLGPFQWASVRHGDASSPLDGPFDAVLVNAGMTHPPASWLDALASGGRMLLPLTATMPAMGTHIGKGIVCRLARGDSDKLDASVAGFVAIYSAIGVREEALNAALGKALMGGPGQWQAVKRLRRDVHDPVGSCWFHGPGFCFSTTAEDAEVKS